MSRKIKSPSSHIEKDFNGDNVPENFNIPEIATLFGTCNLDMLLTNPETQSKLYFKC